MCVWGGERATKAREMGGYLGEVLGKRILFSFCTFFVFRVVYFLSICAIVKSLGLGFKILPSPQFALLLPH